MKVITSKDNEQIKYIRKLKDKKARDESGEFFVEGIKLIREAITEKADIRTVIVCEDCIESGEIDQKVLYEIAKYNCIYTNENVFKSIADVQNPQGILAVIGKKSDEELQLTHKKTVDYSQELIIILDDIQDPGNMGTILRTIDSAGLNQVIVSKGSADIYNPKVVRSTMGAIFRVNIIECNDLKDIIKDLKRHKFEIIATSLNTDKSIYDIKYQKVAVIIGNEANGVSKEVMDLADKKVKIPMLGKTESLNASVATGVILYEYVRHKIE